MLSLAHFSFARSLFVGLGASVCVFAGCGVSNPSKTTTLGSGGAAATTGSSSSSSGTTSGAGGSTTSTSSSTSTSMSMSTSAGTGGGAGGCSSLPLCDGFESDAADAGPSSSLWTIVNGGGCGSGSPFSILVSTAKAHSGTHSVEVMGGDSCGPLMVNTSAFPKITGGDVYGRFYVLLPTDTAFTHAVMMTLGLTADANPPGMSLNQAANLQFASEQVGSAPVLTWQTTDGNIMPDKDTMGAATSTYPAADTWTCVEFHAAASSGALETWVNGTAVPGMTFIPGTTAKTQGVNDQWTPIVPFAPTSLALGWISFSGTPFTLWFDDVALGPSRIGCM